MKLLLYFFPVGLILVSYMFGYARLKQGVLVAGLWISGATTIAAGLLVYSVYADSMMSALVAILVIAFAMMTSLLVGAAGSITDVPATPSPAKVGWDTYQSLSPEQKEAVKSAARACAVHGSRYLRGKGKGYKLAGDIIRTLKP